MPEGLRDLQLEFLRAVMMGGAAPASVEGDGRADAAARVAVYANMGAARFRDALASVYPVLLRVLGDDAFTELCASYMAAHPSRHPSLRWVGRDMPSFLGGSGSGGECDLAALEWARHDVWDAVDEELLDMPAVAALGPEGIGDLELRLVAAHRVVAVGHAVEPVWRGQAERAEVSKGMLLVWREDVSVYHRRVGEEEAGALGMAAVAGMSFGDLCERLASGRRAEEAAQVAAGMLGRWVTDRLLVRCV